MLTATGTQASQLITPSAWGSILAVWNLFWAMVASFAVERVGRRWLFNVSCAGMLVFFTMQTICSAQFALHGTQAAAHAVIAFIFLYYAVYE